MLEHILLTKKEKKHMEKDIKSIVDKLDILYLKKRWEDAQKEIFNLKRDMSLLTLDYSVGTYAHQLDEMNDIIQEIEISKNQKKQQLLKQRLILLSYKNKSMESNEKIQKYLSLRNKYYYLLTQNHDYYKAINIEFATALKKIDIPDIYVYQGEDNLSKHIIHGQMNSKDAQIYPYYELNSKRDYRHFYNQVRFRYLEGLTTSYSFDLNDNKLGKVKIK